MSKIQKKKPSGEKKKRRVDSGGGDSGTGVVQPSAGAARKVKQEKAVAEVATGEKGFVARWSEFFREVKVELKKVTWPTRKQTTGTTVVVIIFVFVVAAFLGLFDYSLSKLVQVVLT